MTTITLRPCPFCGEVPRPPIAFHFPDGGFKWGAISCGCGALGPEVRTQYDQSEDAEWHALAAAEWNTRTHCPDCGKRTPPDSVHTCQSEAL